MSERDLGWPQNPYKLSKPRAPSAASKLSSSLANDLEMSPRNCFKNSLKVFASGICIAAATARITPAQTPDGTTFETATGNEIVTFLQDRGYRAQLDADSQGDPRVASNTQGVGFIVDFYECDRESPRRCGSLQFLASFNLPDEGLSAATINAWNAQFRFGQAAVDEEGDPILRLDVELDGGISVDNLQEWLNRWETSLSSFLEHIGWRSSSVLPGQSI